MRRFLLVLLVVLAFFLHQDVWYWTEATPLLFGVLRALSSLTPLWSERYG